MRYAQVPTDGERVHPKNADCTDVSDLLEKEAFSSCWMLLLATFSLLLGCTISSRLLVDASEERRSSEDRYMGTATVVVLYMIALAFSLSSNDSYRTKVDTQMVDYSQRHGLLHRLRCTVVAIDAVPGIVCAVCCVYDCHFVG